MAAGMLLNWSGADLTIPATPQADQAVASDFERFSGIENSPPLDHPAGASPDDTVGTGAVFGYDEPGKYPRPGQVDQPFGQVYTPGPLSGVVGVVGGQPLPTSTRILRGPGDVTKVVAPSVQWRLGVGQRGPSSLGAAQTVQLSEITNNPPVPGDLSAIIAGIG